METPPQNAREHSEMIYEIADAIGAHYNCINQFVVKIKDIFPF